MGMLPSPKSGTWHMYVCIYISVDLAVAPAFVHGEKIINFHCSGGVHVGFHRFP